MINDFINRLDGTKEEKKYPYLEIDWITDSEKEYIKNELGTHLSVNEQFIEANLINSEETESNINSDVKLEDDFWNGLDLLGESYEENNSIDNDSELDNFGVEFETPDDVFNLGGMLDEIEYKDNNEYEDDEPEDDVVDLDYIMSGIGNLNQFINNVMEKNEEQIGETSLDAVEETMNEELTIREVSENNIEIGIYVEDTFLGSSTLGIELLKKLNKYFKRTWNLHLSENNIVRLDSDFVEQNILLFI